MMRHAVRIANELICLVLAMGLCLVNAPCFGDPSVRIALAPSTLFDSDNDHRLKPKTVKVTQQIELLVGMILELWRAGTPKDKIASLIANVQVQQRRTGGQVSLLFQEFEEVEGGDQLACIAVEFPTMEGKIAQERMLVLKNRVPKRKVTDGKATKRKTVEQELRQFLGEDGLAHLTSSGYVMLTQDQYRSLPMKRSRVELEDIEPRADALRVSPDNIEDTVVIGAGPAGLMLGQILSRLGFRFTIFEQGQIGESWRKIPRFLVVIFQKNFFPGYEHYSDTLKYSTQMQIQEFFRTYVETFGFKSKIVPYRKVLSVKRLGQGRGQIYEIYSEDRQTGKGELTYSRNVVFATGIFHTPRMLGVPGEETYTDKLVSIVPGSDLGLERRHFRRNMKEMHIVVVGGGNSALRVALFLRDKVRKVTMVIKQDSIRWQDQTGRPTDADHRRYRDDFEKWRNPATRKQGDAKFTLLTGARPLEVKENVLVIKNINAGTTKRLRYDRCYKCLGYTPNIEFLRAQGIAVKGEEVQIEPDRLRALGPDGKAIPGLWILGVDPIFGPGVTVAEMGRQAKAIAGGMLLRLELIEDWKNPAISPGPGARPGNNPLTHLQPSDPVTSGV